MNQGQLGRAAGLLVTRHFATGSGDPYAAELTRAVELGGTSGLRIPERDVPGVSPAVLGPGLAGFRGWLDTCAAQVDFTADLAGRLRAFGEGR